MLTVETIGKIRRLRLVDGCSIKAISRKLRVSKNTVRKVLRSGETAFEYRRQNQPKPVLGGFEKRLEEILEEDWKQPRKKRLTAKGIHSRLQEQGYQGAYDSIQRFVRKWRAQKAQVARDVYIPLVFDPGDAYQFDWSCETVVLGGVFQEVKVAHFRLAHSRMTFVTAFPRETLEMVLESHNRAFAFFGGTCRRGIYDNMPTAVDKVLKGKDRKFNARMVQMWSHFLVEPVACTPAAGWEKGQVESQVRDVRRWLFTPTPRFDDMAALNDWLRSRCEELAVTRKHPEHKERTVAQAYAEEQQTLIPWPGPFDAFVEKECRVSSLSLVGHDRNHYSVACVAARGVATLRIRADRIQVLHEQRLIADHPRRFGRGKTVYDPWHYLPVLERKPGALRNGAPFRDWALPQALGTIISRLEKRPGGDRECVKILVAARDHGLPAVDLACQQALDQRAIRSEVVLNLLLRSKDPEDPPPVPVPEGLKLRMEPVADCSRYDRLREACHATP